MLPHPSQNLDKLINFNLSNIRFLHNDEMLEKGIQTNEFLKCCDAMITDYSGIYYDYLCLNRPIAITLDDFEEYKKQHGFVFDNPLDVLKGYYVFNLGDLMKFINEVSNNIDSHSNERAIVNSFVNDFSDGLSSQRVVNFLIEKISAIYGKN